ncbi:transporter [Pontibacillus halophilus JSM 076056 = DSM 19796]|uniref:Transporter n=1 Tax=Pontibacillus halophilus JSM 076056 = DSM 19796 TaxID=1385510 RepID=A0A0A5GJM5_9BACI|nr:EamA family transporter [Pontibacillus halophilus]KGX92199.1 transporter [Pontibacillus halophilus JSM 076056 = DSM 19796]
MNQKWAPFLVLIAAVLWGTTGTTQAMAPEHAHPIAIGATRLAVGGLFLLVLLLATRHFKLRSLPVKMTIFASLCMALYQPLFFSAVSITGVAVGTVVAIGSAPVFSGLTEWAFLKVRPTKTWWFSTALSITGCFMLFAHQTSTFVDPIGILMSLGAGLSFALYTLCSRQLVHTSSPLSVVAIVFTLSALWLSPLLFMYDLSWILSYRGIGVSLQLGIVTTGIAYFLFAKGLTRISPSTAVTLSLAEPLTATLFGVFLLGERLSGLSWTGIFMLIVGIGLLMLPKEVLAGRKIVRIEQ